MMTIVLGLRSNSVGEDTEHYVDIFEKSVNIEWVEIFTKLRIVWRVDGKFQDTIENGFLFIAKLVHLFTNSPQAFLMIIAVLTMGCFGKFIYDNSVNVFLSTYVLMCECLYMSAFNGARQILALSIGINAFTLIRKKKVKSGIAIILLASLIHNSAIIYFLMIPFVILKSENIIRIYKKFKYVIIGCILVPCFLPLVNLLFTYFLPRYSSYFSNNYWSINIGGTMVLWILELLLILMLYRYHFRECDSFELAALVMIYLMLEVVSFQYSAFSRVAWYYRGFLILFFPAAIKGLRKGSNRKVLTYLLLTLLTLAFLSYARVDSRTYSFLLQ